MTSTLAEQKNHAIAVWGCYLAGIVMPGIATLVGLIIAYVKRGDSNVALRTHLDKAIRTFWISLLLGIIGGFTVVIGIGYLILFITAIWFLVVSVKGLIRALDDRAYL